ncbi:MAG: hypothetical protein ACW981_03880 [Candidatus Hodarchaeales archaeon]|jgi:hypothetical protein
MKISYRPYQNPNDLELQTNIWIKATKPLPWAWKPNRTQIWAKNQTNFDPNSKLFALDGENLVGYMSCIRREKFTPIGFPWVIPGYEGEIQDHLFDTVYNHAVNKFKSKAFLQRFRKEWKFQIEFFEKNGFHLSQSYPIYIRDLNNENYNDESTEYETKIYPKVPTESFSKIHSKDPNLEKQSSESLINYFNEDLDLDWVLEVKKRSEPIGMSVITGRDDTGYMELNLLSANAEIPRSYETVLELTINELNSREKKFISMTVVEKDPQIELIESYGFKLRSESVFYSKELKE